MKFIVFLFLIYCCLRYCINILMARFSKKDLNKKSEVFFFFSWPT
jgi:hypothetical protein